MCAGKACINHCNVPMKIFVGDTLANNIKTSVVASVLGQEFMQAVMDLQADRRKLLLETVSIPVNIHLPEGLPLIDEGAIQSVKLHTAAVAAAASGASAPANAPASAPWAAGPTTAVTLSWPQLRLRCRYCGSAPRGGCSTD